MSFRRRHSRVEKPKATVDMTSLIDLTFLLLVTFIMTLPALEQGVTINLPKGKTNTLPSKDGMKLSIAIAKDGMVELDGAPVSLEELDARLGAEAGADAEIPVHIRADEKANYGMVMDVIKLVNKHHLTKMALVTKEN
ncbi:MAG: biopolymer transporter ExbD [Kiritimatiellae bacterium]|nr:biopolymer transporter ExbD [Kiritimatiellia bacterium]